MTILPFAAAVEIITLRVLGVPMSHTSTSKAIRALPSGAALGRLGA